MTQPFAFFECTSLLRPTGRQAQDLMQLLSLIREVEVGVIYHHTHQYYLKAAVEVPDYPNDFATWASESLEERALAEKLVSVDLFSYGSIEEIRRALIDTIQLYLQDNPVPRPARAGDAFFFNDSMTIVIDAGVIVEDLPAFAGALETVGSSSIYFHFFEARRRLGRSADDFSLWLEQGAGRADLARRIRRIDPYQYSLEGLRRELLAVVR